MKKFLSIALCMLAFCASATFVSCGDDDNNSNDNSAVVTPEKQSTTDSPVYWTTDVTYSAEKVEVLEFVTDSKVVRREFKNGALKEKGEYTFSIDATNKIITLRGDFGNGVQTVKCPYSWTENQLVVTMGEEVQTFTKTDKLPN